MHLIQKLIPGLAALAFQTCIAQEAAIQGRITAAGEPLAYANVTVLSNGITADSMGFYSINGLPPGQYTVTASYVGFLPVSRSAEVEPGQVFKLDFNLSGSSLLEEVIVTGSMKPTYVSASPIKVEVVTSKQLDTYLPAAASSIMDGIKMVNGVQEVVACGVCFTNSISVNGLPGAYTAVLMDGAPIYGNLASVYGLNGIPNMIIDRFEVIKGPSSTLYGSEAVAGVINIITKDPAKQPPLAVDLMGTSHLESFGNIAAAPKIGKTAGYLGLNYAYIDDFDDRNGDGFGDQVNLDRYSFFTKWNISRKSGKPFTVSGKYYYEDRRNGVEAFLKDRAYRQLRGSDRIYGESIYTHRAELFGTYELPTRAFLKIDYSLSDHRQDSYYGADGYDARQKIAFANFLWRPDTGKHDLLAGISARYQLYDDNTVATLNPENETNAPDRQFIPGLFLQDEWSARKNLTLLGGARLDHYPAHGLIFSPRFNLKYKPSTWTTLRTNFGTGFRVVNLFTEDHAFITGQRTVEIAGTLLPERSFNGSLNLNHVYTLGNSIGNFDIDAYYTYFRNKILPDYGTPGKIIYANSQGHAETLGVGINLTHNFAFPLAFNLGVNAQRVTRTEAGINGEPMRTDVEFAPKWSGNFGINYRWKRAKLLIAYTLRVTGPMALPEVYDLDENGQPVAVPRPIISRPYAFQNIQVSREFGKWTIYAGAQNLGDYTQQISPLTGFNDPASPPGFSKYFDTAYAYAPLHGREFYLGVKVTAGR